LDIKDSPNIGVFWCIMKKTLFSFNLGALHKSKNKSKIGTFKSTTEFRSVCAQKEIEANVKINPRNTKKDEEEYQYFDDELYKKRIVIEQANAWIDSYKVLLIRLGV